MGPDLSTVPAWPDFLLVKDEDTERLWRAYTDTGRPGQPIFQLWVSLDPGCSESYARVIAKLELEGEFYRAHPNGCPGRH